MRQNLISSVAIAVATSYPNWYKGKLRSIKNTDKIRGDLAIESIQKARNIGYSVVVADWQSPRSFRKELKSIPGAILIKRHSPKRSPSKRKALRTASNLPNIKVLVLTEPEKVSFIENCISFSVEPILKNKADIVIPKRNDVLFKSTYPSFQYESEVEGNRTYNEELLSHRLINQEDNFDMFFGPRILANTKSVLSLFMKRYQFNTAYTTFPKWYFDADEFSNINFFPIVVALKKGFRVESIEVPFEYPNLQRQNEEKGSREAFIEKRKAQRIGLIVELLHFVAFLEKYRGVRIKQLDK